MMQILSYHIEPPLSESAKHSSEGNSPGQLTGYLLKESYSPHSSADNLLRKTNSWLTDSVRCAMRLISLRVRESQELKCEIHIHISCKDYL